VKNKAAFHHVSTKGICHVGGETDGSGEVNDVDCGGNVDRDEAAAVSTAGDVVVAAVAGSQTVSCNAVVAHGDVRS